MRCPEPKCLLIAGHADPHTFLDPAFEAQLRSALVITEPLARKIEENMSAKTEAEFEALVEGMLEEAESVECSQREYLAGLTMMLSRVRDRVELVKSEVGNKDEEEDDTESDED